MSLRFFGDRGLPESDIPLPTTMKEPPNFFNASSSVSSRQTNLTGFFFLLMMRFSFDYASGPDTKAAHTSGGFHFPSEFLFQVQLEPAHRKMKFVISQGTLAFSVARLPDPIGSLLMLRLA